MNKAAVRLHAGLLTHPVHFFALGFGSGLSPWAPGTAGSLVALPFLWVAAGLSFAAQTVVVICVVSVGIWLCGESARRLGAHDHPGIVLDEIAAMISLCFIVPQEPLYLAVAFGLFRLFDITKPWPIRDMDHRLSGGLGIMLDDLMAAFYSGICLVVIFSFR